MCTHNLPALTAAWLNTSQEAEILYVSVQVKRKARVAVVNTGHCASTGHYGIDGPDVQSIRLLNTLYVADQFIRTSCQLHFRETRPAIIIKYSTDAYTQIDWVN